MKLLLAACVLIGGMILGPLAGVAWAHAELEFSDPSPCEIVANGGNVALRFSNELDPDQSSIDVVDSDGAIVARGSVDLFDLEHSTITAQPDAPLAVGAYRVHWKSVSALDSDSTSGSYGFAIGNPAANSSSPLADTDCGLQLEQGRSFTNIGWALAISATLIGSFVLVRRVSAPEPTEGALR